MQVYVAQANSEIAQCFFVMVQLLPELQAENFVSRIRNLMQHGYALAYVQENESVCAVAGFRLVEMLLSTKPYLVIDEIVTDENKRSRGYGTFLFDWLVAYAQQKGCKQIHLDSSVRFVNAHRFYFRKGMHIQGYHFILPLPQ